MAQRFTVVRVGLGTLLLAAAGLKLYGLSVSAVPQVGWFAQPWVQLAAVEWELILGLWLLSGSHPRGAWLAAVGTFLAFAGVSGYLGFIGVASCGCFGAIKASPWAAFGIDVAILFSLGASRKSIPAEKESAAPALVRFAAVTLILFGVAIGLGALLYDSPRTALARLRGQNIVAETQFLDAGTVRIHEPRIRNYGHKPVTLYGGSSDCSCIVTRGLPITIQPGDSAVLPISFTAPGSQGAFTRTAEVWTDAAEQPVVRFVLGCRVVSPTDR